MEIEFVGVPGKDWYVIEDNGNLKIQVSDEFSQKHPHFEPLNAHRAILLTNHDAWAVPKFLIQGELFGIWKLKKGDDFAIHNATNTCLYPLLSKWVNSEYFGLSNNDIQGLKLNNSGFNFNGQSDYYTEANYFSLPNLKNQLTNNSEIVDKLYKNLTDNHKMPKSDFKKLLLDQDELIISLKTTGIDKLARDKTKTSYKFISINQANQFHPNDLNKNLVKHDILLDCLDSLNTKLKDFLKKPTKTLKLTENEMGVFDLINNHKDRLINYLQLDSLQPNHKLMALYCANLNRFGVDKIQALGDEHKFQKALLNNSLINSKLKNKVKLRVAKNGSNWGVNRWLKNGKWKPNADYINHNKFVIFLKEYEKLLKTNPQAKMSDVKGKKVGFLATYFIPTKEYVIPSTHWSQQFFNVKSFDPINFDMTKARKNKHIQIFTYSFDCQQFYYDVIAKLEQNLAYMSKTHQTYSLQGNDVAILNKQCLNNGYLFKAIDNSIINKGQYKTLMKIIDHAMNIQAKKVEKNHKLDNQLGEFINYSALQVNHDNLTPTKALGITTVDELSTKIQKLNELYNYQVPLAVIDPKKDIDKDNLALEDQQALGIQVKTKELPENDTYDEIELEPEPDLVHQVITKNHTR